MKESVTPSLIASASSRADARSSNTSESGEAREAREFFTALGIMTAAGIESAISDDEAVARSRPLDVPTAETDAPSPHSQTKPAAASSPLTCAACGVAMRSTKYGPVHLAVGHEELLRVLACPKWGTTVTDLDLLFAARKAAREHNTEAFAPLLAEVARRPSMQREVIPLINAMLPPFTRHRT